MKKNRIMIFLVALIGLGSFFLEGTYSFDDITDIVLENEVLDSVDDVLKEVLSDESINHSDIANVSLENIPEYSNLPYVIINNNDPFFTDEDNYLEIFESYSSFDLLGRAGVAFAKIDQSLMPTEDRESISSVKPSGWQSVEYDIVSGKYLYNRSHLIGFQLTGENATEENLITGTRSFNVDGMLPFENMVADYIKETNNPVLYRVTPIYEGENLVANGVLMEAKSTVDDEVLFCVYVYNNEPGVTINYLDGTSFLN